jgi:hypothetical protein
MSRAIQITAAGLEIPPSGTDDRSRVGRRRIISGDALMAGVARLGALTIVVLLVVLIAVLSYSAWPSIQTFGWKFIVTSQWRPNALQVPVRDEVAQCSRTAASSRQLFRHPLERCR